MVVKVAPLRYSTKAAAVSDTGITITATRAARHDASTKKSPARSRAKAMTAATPTFRRAFSR
jgi:hypothetical protein